MRLTVRLSWLATAALIGSMEMAPPVEAQGPTLIDRNLQARTVVSGLMTPTSMAFLDAATALVLEKNTGRVMRLVNGAAAEPVLDLAVNFGSERGLLGIAVHPVFRKTGASTCTGPRARQEPIRPCSARRHCSAIASIGTRGTATA